MDISSTLRSTVVWLKRKVVRFALGVTAETNARTRTARSAQRTETDIRSSIGPASCARSNTDVSADTRLG
jgi:hypothetical protein